MCWFTCDLVVVIVEDFSLPVLLGLCRLLYIFCIRPHFCCVLYMTCMYVLSELEFIKSIVNISVKSVAVHVRTSAWCISDLLTQQLLLCSMICKYLES